MPKHRPAGRAASGNDRLVDNREVYKRILIVCEGKSTEPNYFEGLINFHRLRTVIVDGSKRLQVSVDGAARVALSLVNHAEASQRDGRERFDEIWCVFDKDDFPPDDFDNAIKKAEGHDFLRAAWSNEAFELWYVLHFEYSNTATAGSGGKARHHYIDRLNILVKQHFAGSEYAKNDPEMYELLGQERLKTAIKNAKRLLAEYNEHIPYHQQKPATTVHELVETLLQYATGM